MLAVSILGAYCIHRIPGGRNKPVIRKIQWESTFVAVHTKIKSFQLDRDISDIFEALQVLTEAHA